jgi:hypothetical protein
VTWGKKPLVRGERVAAVQGLQDPCDAANLAVQLRPPLLPQRMQVLGRHLPPLRQRTPPRLEKNKRRQEDTRNPKYRRLLLATTSLRRTCHLRPSPFLGEAGALPRSCSSSSIKPRTPPTATPALCTSPASRRMQEQDARASRRISRSPSTSFYGWPGITTGGEGREGKGRGGKDCQGEASEALENQRGGRHSKANDFASVS